MQLRDTLRQQVLVIRQHILFILLGTVVCTCITFGISLYITPTYQASALLVVNGSTTAATTDVYGNQALALSYSLLVTRDDVLQAVSRKLPGVSVNQLRNSVSDSTINNTQIIEIRAQAVNAPMAATIANEVAHTFIQLQVDRETARLQSTADQLSQNLLATKSNVDTAQTQLTHLQNTHAPTDAVTAQQNLLLTYQANYSALLDSYHLVQQHKLQVSNMLSIAQLATPPDQPISPRVSINTLVAALLSLLLLVIMALLFDWLDGTIKNSQDVARLAALEPLGDIPYIASPFPNLPQRVSLLPSKILDEAFVSILTNFSMLSQGKRSILVVGTGPGVGVSTTVTNLATSLAKSGLRVLLVDANLRRPTLHTVFHSSNTYGLVNSPADAQIFQSQANVYAWLGQWQTHTPNLWLLPAGPTSSYTGATLHMPGLRILVAWLRQQYQASSEDAWAIDLVIFDASTLGESSDIVALAAATDAAVLVVEANKAQTETLRKAQTMLERLGSPLLGVIVNHRVGHRQRQPQPFHADFTQIELIARANTAEMAVPENMLLRAPVAQLLPPMEQVTTRETPPQLTRIDSPELADQFSPPLVPFMARATSPLPVVLPPNLLPLDEHRQANDIAALPILPFKGISLPGFDNNSSPGNLRKYYLEHEEQG